MIWLWLALIIALVEWLAAWKNWVMLNRVTKPAVMIALILWFSQQGGWQHGLALFGLALVFSLAGDVFLLLSSNRAFLAGLASFMTAHIFYINGFNQTPFPVHWASLAIFILILVLGSNIGRVIISAMRRTHYTRKMIIPVVIYITVICLMLFSALLCTLKPAWPPRAAVVAVLGGVLFTLSDSLLGYDRFVKAIPHGRFWVMSTYHLAQVSLTTAVLLQAGLL